MYDQRTVAGASRFYLSECESIEERWITTFVNNITRIRLDPVERCIELRITDDPRGDILQLLLAIADDPEVRPVGDRMMLLPMGFLDPQSAMTGAVPTYRLQFSDVRWVAGTLNYGRVDAFEVLSQMGLPSFAEHRITLGYSSMHVQPPNIERTNS